MILEEEGHRGWAEVAFPVRNALCWKQLSAVKNAHASPIRMKNAAHYIYSIKYMW